MIIVSIITSLILGLTAGCSLGILFTVKYYQKKYRPIKSNVITVTQNEDAPSSKTKDALYEELDVENKTPSIEMNSNAAYGNLNIKL